MDVQTIEMPREEAQRALDAYKDALRERHDDELEEVMRGYKVLAADNPLLKLSVSMHEAGVDDEGMPRLAICRADEKWCKVEMRSDGSATFVGFKTPGWQGDENHWATTRKVALPADTLPRYESAPPYNRRHAAVPLVPPPFRPKFALRNYHILFEAEWKRVPPIDPMLLKRISDDLFAVLAMWDLTEVERAVLAGRFTE